MKRKISIMIAGIAAAAVALTGCSGGSDGAQPPVAEQPQSTSQTPSTATSASTESSSTDSPKPSASTSSTSDDDAKPSKTDIVDGLTKFYVSSQGLTQGQAEKLATCMVDETYDKASAQTLKAMRDGDPTKIKPADATLFGTAGAACAKELQ